MDASDIIAAIALVLLMLVVCAVSGFLSALLITGIVMICGGNVTTLGFFCLMVTRGFIYGLKGWWLNGTQLIEEEYQALTASRRSAKEVK